MSSKLVVLYSPFGSKWRWIIEQLASDDVHCKYFSDKAEHFWQHLLQRPNVNTLLAGFQAAFYAKRHNADLLITFDPRLSFWCSLFCRLLRTKTDHVTFSFNFAKLPLGWKQRLFKFAFRQLTALRVHSLVEKALYSNHFGIPEDRIEVCLWGMNVPEVSTAPPLLERPYVSAVGGNARDYQTLLGAAQLLSDVPMVWVVRPDNIFGMEIPDHVRVLTNIPLPQAMNVLAHSTLTVVPLRDSQVPCGHVTLVSSMLLRKPIVVTSSAGVFDYVRDGWNGFHCKPHSAADMADKIRTLWEHPETARTLGENGFQFASEHCTERSVRNDLSAILQKYGLDPFSGVPTKGETETGPTSLSGEAPINHGQTVETFT